MTSRHLDDLRKMIKSRKLIIISEEEGDDFLVSAVWVIENRAGKKIRLIFEGMSDLSVSPIEQSYACRINEDGAESLYFGKNNKTEWRRNLNAFIGRLDILLDPRKLNAAR